MGGAPMPKSSSRKQLPSDMNLETGIPTNLLKARPQPSSLLSYLETEGPFDGVISFSLGAALVSTLLLARIPSPALARLKCVIFFCGQPPVRWDMLRDEGRLELADTRASRGIRTPTAHVWGEQDPMADGARHLAALCNPAAREVLVHGGRHEVPSAGDDLIKAVNVIRRVVLMAEEDCVGEYLDEGVSGGNTTAIIASSHS
ncbi:serine hydrolase-domain-containing protein [Diplogelasinospora grovesii]|uniref:Serine hydrolase-domain-containing protein n=1 Tax=Diplogelasinospora grovesii TaxID=303347 RepID=A0AAN6RZZ1_9PEZI|nr:serine hydrolase-domain-containing protein [Diplogelasinospora grovesii]